MLTRGTRYFYQTKLNYTYRRERVIHERMVGGFISRLSRKDLLSATTRDNVSQIVPCRRNGKVIEFCRQISNYFDIVRLHATCLLVEISRRRQGLTHGRREKTCQVVSCHSNKNMQSATSYLLVYDRLNKFTATIINISFSFQMQQQLAEDGIQSTTWTKTSFEN